MALDENVEGFIVKMTLLTLKIMINLTCKAQIALFIAKKVIIPAKSNDFADLFLKKLAKVLPKWTGINEYAFKLVKYKQPLYRPI